MGQPLVVSRSCAHENSAEMLHNSERAGCLVKERSLFYKRERAGCLVKERSLFYLIPCACESESMLGMTIGT